MPLSHLDRKGKPRMVDVGNKAVSRRLASASGFIRLRPATLQLIGEGQIEKGNVLLTAELAGVGAAKQTSALIPLCHPLALTQVVVDARREEEGVRVEATVKCIGQTGVEMEALTAVTVALLTVYDMCKAVDKTMRLESVELVTKTKAPL